MTAGVRSDGNSRTLCKSHLPSVLSPDGGEGAGVRPPIGDCERARAVVKGDRAADDFQPGGLHAKLVLAIQYSTVAELLGEGRLPPSDGSVVCHVFGVVGPERQYCCQVALVKRGRISMGSLANHRVVARGLRLTAAVADCNN